MLKPSDAYTAQFTTQHPDTAVTTNADSLPTAMATHNGTDDATFTLTVTNLDTGRYKVTGTVPATYTVGDIIQITVNATVNSITAAAIIDQFHIDTKRISDLVDFDPNAQSINVGQWAGNNVGMTDFTVLTNLDVAIKCMKMKKNRVYVLHVCENNADGTFVVPFWDLHQKDSLHLFYCGCH